MVLLVLSGFPACLGSSSPTDSGGTGRCPRSWELSCTLALSSCPLQYFALQRAAGSPRASSLAPADPAL